MANQRIIDEKKKVVEEIASKMKESASYVFFEYRGLTVTETNELRRKLRESDSEFKIYKNTLSKRALETLNIDLNDTITMDLKLLAFGTDAIAPIKALKRICK